MLNYSAIARLVKMEPNIDLTTDRLGGRKKKNLTSEIVGKDWQEMIQGLERGPHSVSYLSKHPSDRYS